MNRLTRKLGLIMTGFAGIFGIRTPPEPDVVAQSQPAMPRGAPAYSRAKPEDDEEPPPEFRRRGGNEA